jgi:hypothetical protein
MTTFFRVEHWEGRGGFFDGRNTHERMAELKDSERESSLALLGLLELLQMHAGAPVNPPFDILKKIDGVDFEWVEVVRDLRTAEAKIQELLQRSPGEYVVFSRRTQQIVGRFKSLAAGA